MKTDRDDPDDLLVLARRGDVGTEGERRLRELLAASPEARALYEAGRAFDDEAPIVAGDDERIAALERQVQRRLAGGTSASRRRRWLTQVVLAAALVTAGAVGAIEWTSTRGASVGAAPATRGVAESTVPSSVAAESPSPHAAPSAAVATARAAPEVGTPPSRPVVAPEVGTPPSRPAVAPEVGMPSPSSRPSVAPAVVASSSPLVVPSAVALLEPSPTAAQLFADANRARMRGDTAEAIRLSQRLADRYPASSEAATARLSLGMLYLQTGDAARALDAFRAAAGTPEASWGEAQALRRLGRAAEERAALEALVGRYPTSAYAAAARKRLATME